MIDRFIPLDVVIVACCLLVVGTPEKELAGAMIGHWTTKNNS